MCMAPVVCDDLGVSVATLRGRECLPLRLLHVSVPQVTILATLPVKSLGSDGCCERGSESMVKTM